MQEEEIENKTRIAQALDDLTIDNKEQDNEINSMKTALSQAIISKDEQMIWKMLQTNVSHPVRARLIFKTRT